VETGLLDWAGVADRMSGRPAAIGRLDGSGSLGAGALEAGAAPLHGRPIEPGSPANLVLYDPAASSTVDPAGHASRSRNSPFAGMVLPGHVVATFLRGTPTVFDGKLAR
jgi:dihydroorotase